METNIKIVEFGDRLSLVVKKVELSGETLTYEQLNRACSIIAKAYKIAAIPYSTEGKQSLITEVHENIPCSTLTVDDWVIDLVHTTDKFLISLTEKKERQLVSDLYKRSLLIQILSKTSMWTLDSPRIFYEKTPFIKSDFSSDFSTPVTDIDAYRRYEISELYVENAGLGFSVGVKTAFISSLSVFEYYSSGLEKRLRKLLGRQNEQKGTLVYDGPTGKIKCYFEGYKGDITIDQAPAFKIKGKSYSSPYAYFKSVHPSFDVKPTDKAALVSFPGMGNKVYVPANRLFVRVMNDMVDSSMSNEDKILPEDRMTLINDFWSSLGEKPFGKCYVGAKSGFYQPTSANSGILGMPDIHFGENQVLPGPIRALTEDYRRSYRSRKEYLNKFGCYFVHPSMEREIYFCYPVGTAENLKDRFANDICNRIKALTKISVIPSTVSYNDIVTGISDLKNNFGRGMTVFVFEDLDPTTYFNIRFELKNWRIKRVTSHQLGKKFKGLNDYKDGKFEKGLKNWNSFIEINAFDIIQQLGCLPFTVDTPLYHDMQLVIDVSEKSSHIVLSLVMLKEGMKTPVFDSLVKPKTDSKKEEINAAFLERYVVELFTNNKTVISKFNLNSLLVLRDGKNCGSEYSSLQDTVAKLIGNGILAATFTMTFVEYHKTTLKEVRLIDKSASGYTNVLEGSYFIPDGNTAILATTGSGTLNQGTASPVMIKGGYGNCDMKKILHDVFISSQLNFSSPSVAQRLTFAAKRADDQLKDRIAQEVMRIK